MKVLVVGGGGREDALVWKIMQNPMVEEIFCAPGNGGTAQRGAVNLPDIRANDVVTLLKFVLKKEIDLTVVGPEEPLVRGIADLFKEHGLSIVGCSQRAAEIEGSKVFAKELMKMYEIPTAPFKIFDCVEYAWAYVRAHGAPLVVKADGLCGGKGVKVCRNEKEADDFIRDLMGKKIFGDAGNKVVIEDCLEGEEVSYIAFTDGKTILSLASSQDHKAIFDGDQGDNTGGMGAYSPAPVVTPRIEAIVLAILQKLIDAMAKEGRPYKGPIYLGLMIDKNGLVWVLEVNCRLGDPETQPVLVRMKSDIVPVLLACAKGDLAGQAIEWDDWPAVCVVMSAKGYPGTPEKWDEITGLDCVSRMGDVEVFHAGTLRSFCQPMIGPDRFLTNSGRVLGVTGTGYDIQASIKRAYQAVKKISWSGAHYRSDIGKKALKGQ